MNRASASPAPWMVLVGPAGAGKTTLGREVAARTHRPFVDLDAAAAPYYAETGWSVARLQERIGVVGRLAAEAEWEPARAHAVARAVVDHAGTVLALGAGHTSYTDHRHLVSVRTALGRCSQVVRVLPSPDREVCLRILRSRCTAGKGRSWIVDGHDFLAHWLDDPGTGLVATRTIYTGDESPAQTATRILRSD